MRLLRGKFLKCWRVLSFRFGSNSRFGKDLKDFFFSHSKPFREFYHGKCIRNSANTFLLNYIISFRMDFYNIFFKKKKLIQLKFIIRSITINFPVLQAIHRVLVPLFRLSQPFCEPTLLLKHLHSYVQDMPVPPFHPF